jgi:glycosyltransferase involved in cell wall biosynthesis
MKLDRMPLVSILMAAYRAEDTVRAAVASVLAQNYEHWELIIASDCGTDFLAVCRAGGLRDGRIRMVATPSLASGPSAARNAALEAAKGEFVTILDGDDTWRPERLAALLPLAQVSGLACDNTRAVTPEGHEIATAHPIGAAAREIDALAMMSSGMPHFPLLRRELASPGYRPELRFAEDVVFNMELIARAGAMTLLPQPLTHYIQWPNSATNAQDAWRRAETAYGQISAMLRNGEVTIPAGQRAAIVDAFAAKRRLNLTYGAAVEAGKATTFQAFMAARILEGD